MSQRTTLDEWRENAEYWTRFAPVIHRMFAPLTRALIEELQIKKGDRVLDIAGGAGEPAFSIASQTGEYGSVTCTDAVPEMVTAARRLATESEIANIEFQNCTAESLPFVEDTFNAVAVSYTHLRAHETPEHLVCRLLLEKKKRIKEL